jgi:hypothetical protein
MQKRPESRLPQIIFMDIPAEHTESICYKYSAGSTLAGLVMKNRWNKHPGRLLYLRSNYSIFYCFTKEREEAPNPEIEI